MRTKLDIYVLLAFESFVYNRIWWRFNSRNAPCTLN